jgi:hypothetical protein
MGPMHINFHGVLKKTRNSEGRKELAHTMVRLQLILIPLKELAHFCSEHLVNFSMYPTTQIYCLAGAIIRETHKILIIINNTTPSSTVPYFSYSKNFFESARDP